MSGLDHTLAWADKVSLGCYHGQTCGYKYLHGERGKGQAVEGGHYVLTVPHINYGIMPDMYVQGFLRTDTHVLERGRGRCSNGGS